MNIKQKIIALCLLLSLSIIVPETAMINMATDGVQTVAVVKAKKKVTNNKKTVIKANKAKKTKKAKTTTKKESQVYVTATGECYHTHACGRGNFYKASLSSAKARGLRPCSKCY